MYRSIERLRTNAAKRGYSPEHDMNHVVPKGYKVKGVSTFYNDEGNPVAQWVKSATDEQQRGRRLCSTR